MAFELLPLRRFCEGPGGIAQRRLLAQLLGVAVLRDLLSLSLFETQLRGPRQFYMPWLPSLAAIAASPTNALLARLGNLVLMTAALALVAQRAIRVAVCVLLLGYGYVFLNDAPGYTNNGALLVLLLGVVVAEPLDDGARLWPVRIGQLTLFAVYVGGIWAKLGSHWLSGNLLREILQHYSWQFARLFGWERPELFLLGAWLSLAAEIAVATGLWFRRTRLAAMALGLAFHVAIEALLPVRMFAPLVLAGYALFLDDERARTWLERTTRLGRSLSGQAVLLVLLWLSNLLGYPTRPLLALDSVLVLASGRLLLRERARPVVATSGSTASVATPARWPTLIVAGFAGLQIFLLAKPAFGASKHLAWRMFSESLVLRIQPEISLAGRWRKARFPDTQTRWREDGFRYHWTSLSEERVYLQGYADWLATTFPDAKPLRLVASYRRDGAQLETSVFNPR